jgi:uncharacterized membrane protein YdjX (TVP38/TMEM64 family)
MWALLIIILLLVVCIGVTVWLTLPQPDEHGVRANINAARAAEAAEQCCEH